MARKKSDFRDILRDSFPIDKEQLVEDHISRVRKVAKSVIANKAWEKYDPGVTEHTVVNESPGSERAEGEQVDPGSVLQPVANSPGPFSAPGVIETPGSYVDPDGLPIRILPAGAEYDLDELLQAAKKIRSKRATLVPSVVFDVMFRDHNLAARLVYLHLFRLSHGLKKDHCFVGNAELASEIGIDRSSVRRSIKELEEKGHIVRLVRLNEAKRQGTVYRLPLPRELVKDETEDES